MNRGLFLNKKDKSFNNDEFVKTTKHIVDVLSEKYATEPLKMDKIDLQLKGSICMDTCF